MIQFLCWLTRGFTCASNGGREDLAVGETTLHHRCPQCKREWVTKWDPTDV